MLDERTITSSLEDLGYVRLKKYTYRALWSSADVEHFLFFNVWDKGRLLAGDFGLRNVAAERFAYECLRLFAGPLFEDIEYDPGYGCSMRFCLGMLAGWDCRSSLNISKMSEAILVNKVACDSRDVLLPVVRHVLSAADLIAFLIRDDESSRWFRTSGAIRAAKIVYLGRQLGMNAGDLELILQPFLREIDANLGVPFTHDWQHGRAFLKKVLNYVN